MGHMETVGHVFLECRMYNVKRKELFDKLAELGAHANLKGYYGKVIAFLIQTVFFFSLNIWLT